MQCAMLIVGIASHPNVLQSSYEPQRLAARHNTTAFGRAVHPNARVAIACTGSDSWARREDSVLSSGQKPQSRSRFENMPAAVGGRSSYTYFKTGLRHYLTVTGAGYQCDPLSSLLWSWRILTRDGTCILSRPKCHKIAANPGVPFVERFCGVC